MLARDRTPNPEWPKIKVEFICLHEGGEPGVAPAKLDIGLKQCHQTSMSTPFPVSAFCYVGFILYRLPTLIEKYLGLHLPRFKFRRIDRCLITSSYWENLSAPYWFWWGVMCSCLNQSQWPEKWNWLGQNWAPHLEIWMVLQEAFLYRKMKAFWQC